MASTPQAGRLAPPSATVNRVLVALLGTCLFLDAIIWGVLTPLLPRYVDELNLSTTTAGLLAGGAALGSMAMSLPAGALAARVGAKPVVLSGLLLNAAATAALAFGAHTGLLVCARLLQGAAGACIWAAGLSWASARAPDDQRGSVLGSLLGLAIAGTVAGPVVGGIAASTSPSVVFALAPVPLLLIALVLALQPGPARTPAPGRVTALLRPSPERSRIAATMTIFLLAAVTVGVCSVLGPLRLDALGAGAAIISIAYLAAGAAEAVLHPPVGKLVDRGGSMQAVSFGIVAMAALAVIFAISSSVAVIVMVIIGITSMLGCFGTPASHALGASAERLGLGESFGFGLFNLTFAAGIALGTTGGGALAQAAGRATPCLLAAGLLLASAALLRAATAPPRAPTAAAP